MLSVRRFCQSCRSWLPLILVGPFLLMSLTSCTQCEAVPPAPSVIPKLFFAGQQVYLYSQGTSTLYALRASDGKKLWQTEGFLDTMGTDIIYIRVVQVDEHYQPTAAFLEAHQPGNGKILWRTRQDTSFHVIGTSAQSVFLSSSNGAPEVIALDTSNGSERWHILLTGSASSNPYQNGSFSVQVNAGVAYLSSGAGTITAYQEQTGKLLWNRSFSAPSDISTIPWFISQGVIYFPSDHLYALRASDGTTLWQRDPAKIQVDPNGKIVYAFDSHHLSALRAQDGQVIWTHDMINSEGSPQLDLTNGILYAGNADSYPSKEPPSDFMNVVFAYRASDGQPLWAHQGNLLAVAGAGETTYLLSYPYLPQQPATLTALRASDGTSLWHQNLAAAAGIAYADGALYTGYGGNDETSGCQVSGYVVAAKYRPTDGHRSWQFQE